MKVQALIELLQTLNPKAEVLLSMDPEGNGFSKFCDHSTGRIREDELIRTAGDLEWYSDQHSDSDCDLEEGERDSMPAVVVLWP